MLVETEGKPNLGGFSHLTNLPIFSLLEPILIVNLLAVFIKSLQYQTGKLMKEQVNLTSKEQSATKVGNLEVQGILKCMSYSFEISNIPERFISSLFDSASCISIEHMAQHV